MTDKKDPFDGEYIGNIWGWRFSLIGAIVLVFMVGLMVYRHYQLDVPFGQPSPAEEVVAPDSLIKDTLQ